VSELVDALAAALAREWPDAPPGAHRRVVAAVCAAVGGSRLYVPARVPGAAAARVVAELAAGATIAQAARAAGVSERTARRVRRTARRGHNGP